MSEFTPTSITPAVDPQNPWPGLASFTEETRAFFYGRDEEIAELSRRVQRKLLTILFGQSGLGKTSILRAGVVPRLRNEGYCPVYVRIDYGRESPPPSEQIKQAVLRATADAGTWTKPGAAKADETLWEFLHHRDDVLRDTAGRTLTPLIIFDQFEEIFTLAQSDEFGRERAARFKEDLADLVENRAPKVLEEKLENDDTIIERFDFARADYRLLISLREDYLPHLDTLKGGMPSITQNRMRLARMTGTQALDAVVKPGRALVSADVARAIVEFVSGARGGSIERLAEIDVEPPLLSVICRELNERRRALGQAQITAEMVTGNRREILTDFYERSIADLPEAMRRFVEDKLLTKSGFRDNLALETALEERGVTKPLIDTLVSRRLLRLEDRIGIQRVELTHDVLADVVRASRDARQQRLALEAAQERERLAMLASARRARRMRWAVGLLGLAVIVLGFGAVAAIRSQRRATELATQTDLILASRLLDEGRLADGVAHLVRAGRKDPKNEFVAPRLLSVLAGNNFALPKGAPLSFASPIQTAVASVDEATIIVQAENGRVHVIDAAKWEVAREITFSQPVMRNSLRVNLRANVNVVMLKDGSLQLFDDKRASAVAPIRPADGTEILPGYHELSPDGRWLAAVVVGSPGMLWIWDTQNGEVTAKLPTVSRYFSFSPDSQRLARYNQSTEIYSLSEGKPVGRPITHVYGGSFGRMFSQSGEKVYVLHSEGAQGYDIATGQPDGAMLKNEAGGRYFCELAPDGSRIAMISGTNVTVFETSSGERVGNPLPHSLEVRAAQFSADGSRLCTNSNDGYYRIWNVVTGTLVVTPMWRQTRYGPVLMSRDGNEVTVFTPEGTAQRMVLGLGATQPLELATGAARLAAFTSHAPARLVLFTPDEARVIDVVNGRRSTESFRIPVGATTVMRPRHQSKADSADVLLSSSSTNQWQAWFPEQNGVAREVNLADIPTGATLATFGQKRGVWVGDGTKRTVLAIWDLATGTKGISIQSKQTVISSGPGAPDLNPTETRLAFQTSDRVVHIWDLERNAEAVVVELATHEVINTFQFSPDGRELLTGGDGGGVQIWDAETGRQRRENSAHRSAIIRFDFSPDGKLYSSLANDGTARVWDAATHAAISSIQADSGGYSRGVEFDRAGARVLAAVGSALRVWDVRSGLPLTDNMVHYTAAPVVLFSPDGAFVAANSLSSSTGIIRVWSVPPRGKNRPTPAWLLTFATICTGQKLSDEGRFVSASEEFAGLDEIRRQVAVASPDDTYAEWGRWMVSREPTRSVAPGFKILPTDAGLQRAARDREIALGTPLVEAIRDGRWREAEAFSREILEIREQRDGSESYAVGGEMYRLAAILHRQGKSAEAEPLARNSVRLQEKSNATSYNYHCARSLVGQILVTLERFAEAESFLLQAANEFKSRSLAPVNNPLLFYSPRDNARALADLYAQTDQPDKAAQWKAATEAEDKAIAAAIVPGAQKQPMKKAGKKKAP